ncbi:MAG: InlB B-repeat-containing protein, partial [Lachnospiraceae bacterium]|nr:InlB B-repeat-containing protein [Lachnospiraceae bacterium]
NTVAPSGIKCSEGDGTQSNPYKFVTYREVTLSPSATTLTMDGDAVALTAAIELADKTVKWSTGSGKVTLYTDEACTIPVGTDATSTLIVYAKGVTAGNDTVTVTSNADAEKSASCNVTVNKKAGTISYATTSVSKTNGDAAFTNALTNSGDGTVAYASDNTDVATVNATTGEVTIQSYGEANITATVTDGDNYTYATKTASYKLTVAKRSYEVKFDANGHGTAPASQNVEEDGKATKPADLSSTDYDFTGWYKESACTNKWNFDTDTVTEPTTIFAGWKIKTFTVTWTNYDDTVLDTDTVNYGATPKYTGETPTKPADAQYTYTFVGWTPAIDAATGDVTYKATYTNAKNKYTVRWLNYDNTVLQEGTVDFGVTPEYTGTTPTKPADEQYTYTFLSWTPVVVPVVDNVVYIATYNNTVNKYTIKFVDEDGTEISSAEYDYGTSANDIVKPNDPTKDATSEYTYTFAGWDSEVTDVMGNKTYKATYTQTEIKKDDGEKAVSTDVKKDEKSPEVKAANLTDEFAESTLSNEEKTTIDEAINNGEDVNVDVYLEIKDISDAISPSDKEKIKASTTNADNIEYFDISVFKEISISGQSQGATSIHELTTPLKLTIGVPKSFPAVADGYTRTYKVLRLHD